MTTPTTVQVQIQLRADTAANWTAQNPTLLAAELGLETDTKKIKIGDGTTAWASLAYFPFVVSGGTVLGNLEIGTTGTLTFEGSTADGFETTLGVVNPTADRTINLPNQSGTVIVSGNASIVDADINASAEIAVSKLADGAARQLLQTDAAGTGVEWASNIDVPGTLDVTGAATFDSSVTITGDLTVNGTTTNINTQNLVVEDKNIILADVTTPSDSTADGGGITLKGSSDKTITWSDTTDSWEFNQPTITTGSSSAASFIPTSSTVPSNGVYLSGANTVAVATNSTGRLFVDASGNVEIAGTGKRIRGDFSNATHANRLSFQSNVTDGATSPFFIPNGTSQSAQVVVTSNSDPTNSSFLSLGVFGSLSEGRINCDKLGTGSYLPLTFLTGGFERLRVTSSGNVGIGTSAPGTIIDAQGTNPIIRAKASTGYAGIQLDAQNSSHESYVFFSNGGPEVARIAADSVGNVRFCRSSAATESARIDSSGRLLVGTSSARAAGAGFQSSIGSQLFIEQPSSGLTPATFILNRDDANGPRIVIGKSRGTTVGSSTIVQAEDALGFINFAGADGTDLDTIGVQISALVDGTPGANDMPGRLVFSTTADGASSPTERVRITSQGYFKASDVGGYVNSAGNYHEFVSNRSADTSVYTYNTNASLAANITEVWAAKAASNTYSFLAAKSNLAGTADAEFVLYGDGNGKCDGAWTGGGADYAEYFEWSDSNPDAEDRRGISVVLDGDKIRPAVAGEDPIGVISGNPSVVGDAAWNKWSGKYLRDEFGTYILEDYEVTDDDGNIVTQQRRKLNPAYDPDVEYTSREERPEWDCVGLMGKLRIRKGQPTGSRWIKMRDISDSVEEWLVR